MDFYIIVGIILSLILLLLLILFYTKYRNIGSAVINYWDTNSKIISNTTLIKSQ